MRSGIPWKDTAIMPKLFLSVDARVAAFFLLWGLHMSWLTFYLAISATIFFVALIFVGQTPTSLWRWVAQRISGTRMESGIPLWMIVRSMRH